MPIWRSGDLLKLIPQLQTQRFYHSLPAWSSLLLWALIQGKCTLTSISSVCARAQFSPQVQLLPWGKNFALLGMHLLNMLCAGRLSFSEPLFMLPSMSTAKRRSSGLKTEVWNLPWICLSLYFGVPNLIFKVEEKSAPPFQFRTQDEVTNTECVSLHLLLPFTSKPTRSKHTSPVCY